ncbi:hypothetical protein PISMIDRAFT_112095 [Pisolithus microcarpus 441]|uniref:Uncharacterized protein n=1 Tax=Pisolithus microcarpus 441 TaxID=765257 RepID=A0A0C9ZB28_9AGAM|nr:hypothetical protein BKA83DRAFT_112095 [Pisolithus microcarpus]KIK17108.1 hypothetical protein PISMIDRAFT_112095 [Pisolithus microcarpus 441]
MANPLLSGPLDEWREQTMSAIYGWHHLNNIRPSIVMCNAMLDHIVNCTHHHKISSIQDLRRETAWPDADRYRGEVLSLIQRHVAPLASPFISIPLQEMMTSSNVLTVGHANPSLTLSSSGAWRKVKCGACGQEGHNGKSSCLSIIHPSLITLSLQLHLPKTLVSCCYCSRKGKCTFFFRLVITGANAILQVTVPGSLE